MMNSKINVLSRAGLVALVFALISISLVSATPIPVLVPRSVLSSVPSSPSNPGHNGQGHIQQDTRRITRVGHMSRAPSATRALAANHHLAGTYDDQFVRRSFFSKIGNAFKKVGQGIKHAAQKVGHAVKRVAQKVGHGVKQVAHKVGHAVRKVAHKVGHAIKKVAHKVVHGIRKVAHKVVHGIRKVAHKIGQVARKVGSHIKKAVHKVGHAIKKVAHKVGHAIKQVAHKVGTAVKKVGHWIKTNAPSIAKFGLKVAQTAGKVVGKVASFVPGVGKPLGMAIEVASKGAGIASDHIHAKLPGGLEKGMNIMNKADQIMDYLPRDLSEEEAFQQRDDAHYFEDTEDIDISLEHREEFYYDDDYEQYLDGEY